MFLRSIMRGTMSRLVFTLLTLLVVAALSLVESGTGAASGSTSFRPIAWQDVDELISDPLNPLEPPVFGPNVRANRDTTTFGQHEPSLAVSRVNTNTVFVAAKD